MSRAFVKEGDGSLDPLPDLPVSPHPNHVTPTGLAALQQRLRDTQTRLAALKARPDRLDKLPEAAAERDIRYLESRLRSAILIDPATLPTTEVAFGHIVTVADDEGREHRFQITGEDEADATAGRITPQSPLARALIGASVGDVVKWRKPSGSVDLEILAIEQP
ncbi:GreA/GreB family elongation factor [Rhodobacteraceae bacterium HSP-20]|uniref:GreA/GreB family elongation factor n=1 Tax=Paragemmobacter amnigenus TaxID=2852097 RepID=A0ABS6J2T2_9RHOB|nr:GreA/GreB family elongation factor [Rhodobacter amnigenus]MBU9698066.1 GreA/GreB family elongation factor [Rhodobacter amnigenus]MBV4389293.1 GreA/GreB family elongation factor [Rhodobacter amnigenus]